MNHSQVSRVSPTVKIRAFCRIIGNSIAASARGYGPDQLRAEACFIKAMEIARDQEARLLELRATTDLAQLWRDTKRDGDPRALLEPILAMMEGGETTRDVRNARALLANLV
jgi:predicted ATPase